MALIPGNTLTAILKAHPVIGNIASGVADDSSEPVKVGGRYNATPPTLTDTQRGDAQMTNRGQFAMAITDGTGAPAGIPGANVSSPSDSKSTLRQALEVITYNELFNGTSWDRQRNNIDTAALITAAAATTTQTGADQTNNNARGVVVVFDVTAVTASGSFTLSIQGKDAASGKYYTLLTGTARSTTGTDVLTIYPAVTVAANAAVSTALPRIWRVVATYNSGTNATFTVGASVIL